MPAARTTAPKTDTVLTAAVEVAHAAAERQAGDFGVGEYLGCEPEGERLLTHHFACPHHGYRGWRWAVTLTRAPRARTATVDEVVLVPGADALLAAEWVPWADRIRPDDVTPGTLLPTPDNDPRLEPGFTGGEMTEDDDPAEWSAVRAIATDLGLGRERVLSHEGRSRTAERWLAGEAGPDNASTRHAPGQCAECAYFQRISGSLGTLFGVCTNEHSPRDAAVVSVDHGCGGHSNVVADQRGVDLPEPVYDTIGIDRALFD